MTEGHGSGLRPGRLAVVADIRTRDVVGSVLLAGSLAVAQPVLDLLSRNVEFFVAQQAPAGDIVLLALLVAVVVPLLVALASVALIRVARPVGLVAHGAVIGLLGAAFAAQVLERLSSLPTAVLLSAACVVGLAAALAFYGVAPLQTMLRWGNVVPVLVLVLFLVVSPVSRQVLPTSQAAGTERRIGNPVPVVIMLFDELPVTSLMTADGELDAELFPNFARLLEDFTWFRNTTTRYDHTHKIVPSMLTGTPWEPDREPVVVSYPDNLFTLLGGDYDVMARELVSWLCPTEVCDPSDTDFRSRFGGLLSDVTIVGQHVVLPRPLTGRLPPIDGAWGDFGAGKTPEADPATAETEGRQTEEEDEEEEKKPPGLSWGAFLESFKDSDRPLLRYYHIILPHYPFSRLPDGRTYPEEMPMPAYEEKLRPQTPGDDFYVLQAHQRHLLQAGAVDENVRELLDTLRGWPAYDDALVFVLADHGASFRMEQSLRTAREGNVEELAYVPLFVKAPGQTEGGIDDRPAMITDLMPTVADALDIDGMWAVEGTSLFEDAPDPQRQRPMHSLVEDRPITVQPDASDRDRALAEKVARFGPGGDWEEVYNIGPYARLHGSNAAEWMSRQPETVDVQIDHEEAYRSVDTSGDSLPALLNGRVRGDTVPEGTWLAVALNGRVASTTVVHQREAGGGYFSAMIPPSAFVDGDNGLALYRIEEVSDGTVALHPLRE